MVALAGPDALAALRSLPVRLREPVRTARHLQRDAARRRRRAGRRRVHDDPLPARPARVHPAREDLPRLLRRPAGAAEARLRGLRSGRQPIRWPPGDRRRLPPGLRGGGAHVSPDRRRARARAYLRCRLRLRPAPLQRRARLRCRQRPDERLALRRRAGDARARRRARRLLRAQRNVDRRPGLAVPRATRLAGPRRSLAPVEPHRDRRCRTGNRSCLVASLHRRRRTGRLSRLPGQPLHLHDDVDLGQPRHRREQHELVHDSRVRLRRAPEPAADDPLPPRPRRRRRTGEARPRHGSAAGGRTGVGATRGQDRPSLLAAGTRPRWPARLSGQDRSRGSSR